MRDSDTDKANVDRVDRDQVDTGLQETSDSAVANLNERPGLLDGPFIPPVALAGPSAGTPNVGMGSDTGTGAMPFPIAAVPVVGDGGVESGRLVNPFAPADPDNDAPFDAGYPSSSDLPSRAEAELAGDGRLNGANIVVLYDGDGIIRLTGTAPSSQAAEAAANIVGRMPGVAQVVNEVSVAPVA